MSSSPDWRQGEHQHALALAGICQMRAEGLDLSDLPTERREAGCELPLDRPLLVASGSVRVVRRGIKGQDAALGSAGEGALFVPIGTYADRAGVRLEAATDASFRRCPLEMLISRAVAGPETAARLARELLGALERQHWVLRLSAAASPRQRLAALLAHVAETAGTAEGDALVVRGAPDVREMSVLAGVSRESATLNLEWLRARGLVATEGGRLAVYDLDGLRTIAEGTGGE